MITTAVLSGTFRSGGISLYSNGPPIGGGNIFPKWSYGNLSAASSTNIGTTIVGQPLTFTPQANSNLTAGKKAFITVAYITIEIDTA